VSVTISNVSSSSQTSNVLTYKNSIGILSTSLVLSTASTSLTHKNVTSVIENSLQFNNVTDGLTYKNASVGLSIVSTINCSVNTLDNNIFVSANIHTKSKFRAWTKVDNEMMLPDIEALICQCIFDVTGLTVVNERRPGPQLAGAYATYRTLAIEGADYPEKEYPVGPDYTENIRDFPLLRTQIKIIGKDAYFILGKFCALLRSADRYTDLWRFIGLAGVEEVQNIQEYFNGRQQEMAVVHINFYIELDYSKTIDYFDSNSIVVIEPIKPFRKVITV
jgi:hypothetical protein